MSCVIHINGWPGSGKLTIARALAPLLEARLMDAQLLNGPADRMFERREPMHASLRAAVRKTVLDHAAKLAKTRRVIFIDTYSDTTDDRHSFEAYKKLAGWRGTPVISVLLEIDESENTRRLASEGRGELGKLTNPERLIELRARYQLLRGPNLVELDVTTLSADQAAQALAERIRARGV